MKITLVGVVLASTLSITKAADLNRILIERVSRSPKVESTSHHVEKALARYSNEGAAGGIRETMTRSTRVSKSGIKSNRSHSRMWGQRGHGAAKESDTGHTGDAEMDRYEKSVVEATARRSKQIDSERVPIEYNPSEVAFVGQVGIGTPNQYFNLEFDIGSSDTWVTSAQANCSRNTKCPAKKPSFHPERSTTFETSPGIPWKLNFKDGLTINGTLASDVVQVAQFVVQRQVIGLAQSFTDNKENGIDGSFGLGLRQLTFRGDPTPIDNLIKAGSMRSQVGVWLGAGSQGGELTFGGRDRSRYYGDLAYYNVPMGSAYWSTPVESITVVSNQLLDDGSNRRIFRSDQVNSRVQSADVKSLTGAAAPPNVIFDTSTNLILVPPRVAREVHRHIHNSLYGLYSGYSLLYGLYTVSCSLGGMDTDIWIDLGPSLPRTEELITGSSATTNRSSSSTLSQKPKKPSSCTPQEEQDQQHDQQPQSSPSNDRSKRTLSKQHPFEREEDDPPLVSAKPVSQRFRVSGKDLVRERIPVFGGLLNLCFSGIQASKYEDDDWVLGNTWFMNNYMTLDHRHRQIGIAPAVQF